MCVEHLPIRFISLKQLSEGPLTFVCLTKEETRSEKLSDSSKFTQLVSGGLRM